MAIRQRYDVAFTAHRHCQYVNNQILMGGKPVPQDLIDKEKDLDAFLAVARAALLAAMTNSVANQ